MSSFSGNIRKNLSGLGITYNEDAVVTLTNERIPLYVKVVSSLGKNFSHIPTIDKRTIIDANICLHKIANEANNYQDWSSITCVSGTALFDDADSMKIETTHAQRYISELTHLTKKFLNKNPSIIIITADKGGKSVIMKREDYDKKVKDHIEENVASSNYVLLENASIYSVQSLVESTYKTVINAINPFFKIDNEKGNGPPTKQLDPEPYLIPLMYGCPKIHKQDVPVRPIIASPDAIGSTLSKWLLSKLNLIARKLDHYNVLNTRKIIKDLKYLRLEPDHELCSYDYVSMYTNVDMKRTIPIITEHYHVIAETTSVPPDVFIACLEFFTSDAAFFLFKDEIFKQIKGLAMGNNLAQILAEIRTNYAIAITMKVFDATIMSLFYKYVDDILSGVHKNFISAAKECIEKATSMELTIVRENAQQEVEFLDCTYRRNLDGSITYRWFKKNCSSMSIINYHSYHPPHVKWNAVSEMIKRASQCTSPEFMNDTVEIIVRILKNSSYPQFYITEQLSIAAYKPSPNVLSPSRKSEQPQPLKHELPYIAVPYLVPLKNKLQSIIERKEIPLKLAMRPIMKNKSYVYSKIKDARNIMDQKDTIFELVCNNCSLKWQFVTGAYDVKRTIINLQANVSSPINKHIIDFPEHKFQPPRIIRGLQNHGDVKHIDLAIKFLKSP